MNQESAEGNFLVTPIDEHIGMLVYIEGGQFSNDDVFIIQSFDLKNKTARCTSVNDDNQIYEFPIGQLRSALAYEKAKDGIVKTFAEVKEILFEYQRRNGFFDQTLN